MKLKSIKNWLIVFGIMSLISCSKKSEGLNAIDITKIEKEVLVALEMHEESLTNGKLDEVSKFYSEDDKFYWVENGTIAYPTGVLARKAIKEFYPSLKSLTFTSLNKKITPLSKSLAMAYVEYKQVLVFQSEQEIDIIGAMTILMKKEGSNWQFLIGHSSGKNENQR